MRGVYGGVFSPDRQLAGQVFLDRHRLVEIRILREVGDAKAALSEDLADFIPMQPETDRQGVAMFTRIGVVRFLSLLFLSHQTWRSRESPKH